MVKIFKNSSSVEMGPEERDSVSLERRPIKL